MKNKGKTCAKLGKAQFPGYGLVSKKYSEIWSNLGRMLKADTSLYCKQGVNFTESKRRTLKYSILRGLGVGQIM